MVQAQSQTAFLKAPPAQAPASHLPAATQAMLHTPARRRSSSLQALASPIPSPYATSAQYPAGRTPHTGYSPTIASRSLDQRWLDYFPAAPQGVSQAGAHWLELELLNQSLRNQPASSSGGVPQFAPSPETRASW